MTQKRSKLDEALLVLAYEMGRDAYRLRLIEDESNLERMAIKLYGGNESAREAYIAGYGIRRNPQAACSPYRTL